MPPVIRFGIYYLAVQLPLSSMRSRKTKKSNKQNIKNLHQLIAKLISLLLIERRKIYKLSKSKNNQKIKTYAKESQNMLPTLQ